MKKLLLTLILCLTAAIAADAQGLKRVYDESIDPIAQIDAAIAKAGESGRNVVCQVGGNWCKWCLRFADFITKDEEIAKMVDDNYVYIHVNLPERDREPIYERLGLISRFGYPVMVVLDAEGRVLHTQDSSFLEEDESYSKKKVMRFFKNWTPAALKGEK